MRRAGKKARSPNPKDAPISELTDSLRQIYYLVGRYPLHKLVPSEYLGAPGYAKNGTFVSEDEGKHLSVRLGASYDYWQHSWYCWIKVTDADDLVLDYYKPFTLEEWTKALALYDSLYMISTELLMDFE